MEAQANKAGERSCSIASLIACCAILAATLLPLAVAIGWFGYGRWGLSGVTAAAAAALICWLSASLALVSLFVGQRLGAPVQGVLVGMIFRMGLPLGLGMLLHETVPTLAAAGVFWMILALYLVALVVETLLSLRFVPANHLGALKPAGSLDTASGIQSH